MTHKSKSNWLGHLLPSLAGIGAILIVFFLVMFTRTEKKTPPLKGLKIWAKDPATRKALKPFFDKGAISVNQKQSADLTAELIYGPDTVLLFDTRTEDIIVTWPTSFNSLDSAKQDLWNKEVRELVTWYGTHKAPPP